jgi:UDP-3-O-[3-hydroxymyristoyl] glucosamine N-acyltransferase
MAEEIFHKEVDATVADNFVSIGKDAYIFAHAEIREFVKIDAGCIIPPGCIIESFTHVKKKDILTEWTIYQGTQIKKIGSNDKKKSLSYDEISLLESCYLERLVKRRMQKL